MYQSLQACRIIAALLVVLFHLGGTFAQARYFGFKAIDGPFAWADSGVEFFFVLSGFLIAHLHRRDFGRPRALGSYLIKRGLRIYPTFWVVCALVCAAATLVPSLHGALPHSVKELVLALLLVPQDPAVVGGVGAPILFVAWSLQYEMMFYAVVAVFILSRSAGAMLVAGGLVTALACHFGASCEFPVSFMVSKLMLLFGMGVACAFLLRTRFQLPNPVSTALVAAGCFVAFGMYEVAHGRFEDGHALDRRLVYGLIASVLLVALVQAEEQGRLAWLRRQRWIGRLGDSSYALYLLHIPVISLLCKGFAALGIHAPIALVALYAGIAAACVLVALAFNTWVERPMLDWLRRRTRPRRPGGAIRAKAWPATAPSALDVPFVRASTTPTDAGWR